MPLPKKESPKKDSPRKGKNLLDEATKEMNAGKYGRAAGMLKELVAAEPKNQQARRLFATLHLKTGNLITAKSAFDSLIRSALEAQDYWLAESLLREYLTAGPRYVPFLVRLGEVLEAKGDVGAAATEYGRAIEILTDDPDPDQPDQAKQLFERVQRIAPASPVVARWAETFAPPPPPAAATPPPPAVDQAPSASRAPSSSSRAAQAARPTGKHEGEKKAGSPTKAPAAPPTPDGPPAAVATAPQAPAVGQPPPSSSTEGASQTPATSVPQAAPPSVSTWNSAPAAKKVLSLEELLAEVSDTAEEHRVVPPAPVVTESSSTAGAEPVAGAPSVPDADLPGTPPLPAATPASTPDEPVPASSSSTEAPSQEMLGGASEPVAAAPAARSADETGPSAAPSTTTQEAAVDSSATNESALGTQPETVQTGLRFASPSESSVASAESADTAKEPEAREAESVFQMAPSESPEIDEGGWAPPPTATVEPETPPVQVEAEPTPVAPWEAPAEPPPTPAPSEEPPPSDSVFGLSTTPDEPARYVPWTPTEEDAIAPSESETVGTKNFFDQETFSIAALGAGSQEAAYTHEPVYETARPAPVKRKPLKPAVTAKLALQIKSWLASAGAATKTSVVISVLVIVLSILTFGGITLAWLALEQQPTSVYQELARVPPRTLQEPARNGYLMLMGFTEAATGDPVRAGQAALEATTPGRTHWCFGGQGASGPLQFPPEAGALSGMYGAEDPVAQFANQQGVVRSLLSGGAPLMTRYRQWLPMSFEDWGYGVDNSPDCEQILTAHRLYIAEGFLADFGTGFDRLEKELNVWRTVMAAAKTLSVKMLAVTAVNEDLMVLGGLLARPDFSPQLLPRVTNITRSLDSFERSMKWPVQNEAAVSVKLVERTMAPEVLAQAPAFGRFLSHLPMPRQRVLNAHAEYFDSLVRVGEAPSSRLPRLYHFAHTPAKSPMDYLINPIENVFGALWIPDVGDLTGRVVEIEARLRLVGLLERIRRPSFDPNVLSRIAKAGQGFYDPFTDIPMLVSTDRRRLYSVGRDRQDGNGDPRTDVSVLLPTRLP